MKKLIPILATVAIVGILGVVFYEKSKTSTGSDENGQAANMASTSSSTSGEDQSGRASLQTGSVSSESVAPSEPPKVEIVDSLLGRLTAQSLLVIDILPRNVDELAKPVGKFYERLSQTKAWKKLQPDSMIAAGAEKAAEGNPALGALAMMSGGTGQVPPEVKELWSSLSELSLAFATKTIPIEAEGKRVNVPPLALVAKFNSEESAKKYIDLLSQQIEMLKAQAEMMGAQVNQPNPATLEITAPVPGMAAPVSASLSMKSPHIVLLLGTKDLLDFFEKKGSTPSPSAVIASRSWVNKTAIAGSFRLDDFLDLIFNAISTLAVPGQSDQKEFEQMKTLLGAYKGAKLATFAFGTQADAMQSNSCFNLAAGSTLDTLYTNMLKKSSVSVAAPVIDDQTLFALEYPVSMLQQSWSLLKNDKSLTEKLGPDQQKGLEAFEKVTSTLSLFDFQKLAVVGSGAAAGALPRFAVLFTDAKLSGDDLLTQFTKSINELVAFAQTSQGGAAPTEAAATLDKSGATPQIKIQAGLMQLTGQLAGNNSIAFSIDPFYLSTVADKLAKREPSSFLNTKFASAKSEIARATQVTYINTGLLFDLAKPWMGAVIPPQANVSQEEVEEIMTLLKTSIVSTQRFEQIEKGLICSYGSSYQG